MVEHLELWRKAGKVGALALATGVSMARPGQSLIDIAEEVEKVIRTEGALPSFPVNLSIDVQAAHYTPSPEDGRRLRDGEVLKVDVGAQIDGYASDNAATVEVGSSRHAALLGATRDALESGSAVLRGGMDTRAVSQAIERAIHARGLKPIVDLSGHTIERYLLHAGKSIPNSAGQPPARLEVGEVVAVEPFATNGQGHIHDGPFGNIMRFRTEPPADREPELAALFTRFRTLPFCLRWVADPEVRTLVLRRRKFLQTYPVFLETGGGLVSQAEKTFLLLPDGAETLT